MLVDLYCHWWRATVIICSVGAQMSCRTKSCKNGCLVRDGQEHACLRRRAGLCPGYACDCSSTSWADLCESPDLRKLRLPSPTTLHSSAPCPTILLNGSPLRIIRAGDEYKDQGATARDLVSEERRCRKD